VPRHQDVIEQLDAERAALDSQSLEARHVSCRRRDPVGDDERDEHQLDGVDAICDRAESLGVITHDVATGITRARERCSAHLPEVVESDKELTDEVLIAHERLDHPRRIIGAIYGRQLPPFGA